MTDKEIINGLIIKDNQITTEFFFVKCRPLFYSIIRHVFSYDVDYDEFVNELYQYLMDNNAAKLHGFQYRCSLMQWLKVLAIHYFVKKRNMMIKDSTQEPLYITNMKESTDPVSSARSDLERIFNFMQNKRYVYVIRKLVIEDMKPEQLAQELGVTTANLYNIKRRAMFALTEAALKDIKHYGK